MINRNKFSGASLQHKEELQVNCSKGVWLACGIAMAMICAATAMAQDLSAASRQDAPPAEAFRVLPPPGPEGPQISPYLLYQTSLAWNEDELRRDRWSK
jgi:hypothetical protein